MGDIPVGSLCLAARNLPDYTRPIESFGAKLKVRSTYASIIQRK